MTLHYQFTLKIQIKCYTFCGTMKACFRYCVQYMSSSIQRTQRIQWTKLSDDNGILGTLEFRRVGSTFNMNCFIRPVTAHNIDPYISTHLSIPRPCKCHLLWVLKLFPSQSRTQQLCLQRIEISALITRPGEPRNYHQWREPRKYHQTRKPRNYH